MKNKKVTINGNELEYVFDSNSRIYWLDEDGKDTQLVDEADEICYEHAFASDIYVNHNFVAYVNDDVFDYNTPYEAVKTLKSFGFELDEAIEVYNEIARAIEKQNRWFYLEKDFYGDQAEEEWQREWRAEMANNQPPEAYWYNKYKNNQL